MSGRADPGLAAQRTRLAWQRTATSAAVVALLAARPAVTAGAGRVQVLAAAAALAGWTALVALSYRRGRGLAARPPTFRRRTVPAYALIIVGFALVGVVLVVA